MRFTKEIEKKKKENPYRLSIEELSCPDKPEQGAWLDRLIKRQREGVDHGVRPQNPRWLTPPARRKWLSRVWNYYLSHRSPAK